MGEVVNLNHYRKQRKKEDKTRRVAENRARSSRTPGERLAARREASQQDAEIEGKRLEKSSPDEPTSG